MAAPPPVPALPDTDRVTSYAVVASSGPLSVGFALYGDSTDYTNWLTVTVNGVALSPAQYALSSLTGPIATIPRPITDATISFTSPQTGTVVITGAQRPRRLAQLAENQGVAARDFNQIMTTLFAIAREAWTRDISVLTALNTAIALFTSVTAGSTAVNNFATRAAAAAANIPSSTLYLMVAGYAAVGDGGDGLYKQIPGPVVTPDQFSSSNGTCFQLANRRQCPQHYGALANGSDDSVPLQNWLNRLLRGDGVRGDLYGQYTYGTTLTIADGSNQNGGLVIEGSGFDGSCGLFYTGSANGIDMQATGTNRNYQYYLSGFILDGNSTGLIAINGLNLADCTFERIHIKNFKSDDWYIGGTVSYGGLHVVLRDCKSSPSALASAGSYAVNAVLCNYLVIDNCYFNGGAGPARTTLVRSLADTARIVFNTFESATHSISTGGGDATIIGNGHTGISGTIIVTVGTNATLIAGDRSVTNLSTAIDYSSVSAGKWLNFTPEQSGSPVFMTAEIGPFKIIAIRFNTTTNGNPINGLGATCSSNATGDSTITFTDLFNGPPLVHWTTEVNAVFPVNKQPPTSSTARVQVYNTSGVAADSIVTMIAIGAMRKA